jgi:hypothetical protein
MEAIAKALVFATQFVAARTRDSTEDDVQALEDVAFILRSATPSERLALVTAAEQMGLSGWADEMGIDGWPASGG